MSSPAALIDAFLARLVANAPTAADCAVLAEALTPIAALPWQQPGPNSNLGDDPGSKVQWWQALILIGQGAGGGSVTVGGQVQVIEVTPGTAASTSSATALPATATVVGCQVLVSTPYSAGATIEVGQTGALAAFQGTGDNTPTADGLYVADQQSATASPAAPVTVTIGGAPSAGACVVFVFYTTPST